MRKGEQKRESKKERKRARGRLYVTAKPQVFTSMTFTRNVSEPDGEHLRMQMKLRGLLTGCHPQGMEAASFLVIVAP